MKNYLVLFFILFISFSCDDETTLSNQSEMLSYSIEGYSFDFLLDNNSWRAKADKDTDLSNLIANFELSPKATVSVNNKLQTSGISKNDFTTELVYEVRAEDGTKSEYYVTLSKTAVLSSVSLALFPDVVFVFDEHTISATVPNGVLLNNLVLSFETTEDAQLFVNNEQQISGESVQDFTSTQHYVLVEEDGNEISYEISIINAENLKPVAHVDGDVSLMLSDDETTINFTLDASNSYDMDGEITDYTWTVDDEVLADHHALVDYRFDEGLHSVGLEVLDNDGALGQVSFVVNVFISGNYLAIDANATAETQNLLKNIGAIGISSATMFGQEFPLSFKLESLRSDLSTSDCYEVTGSHPALFGIDPHYILYKTDEQRKLHIAEAKWAYDHGAVVTFDFHQQSRFDHEIYMDNISNAEDKRLMYDIVFDQNNSREWFYDELDEILSIINDELQFPIVLRLFHEMNGAWFWWGSSADNHSTELYIDFYRLAVDYIRDRSNLVLFAWSPNDMFLDAYYPGDDYVDIVGFDMYEPNVSTITNRLKDLSKKALAHNKIAVLSETGDRNNTDVGSFWEDIILKALEDGGQEIRIAWVLAWFNAPWCSAQSDLFIPNAESSEASKTAFKNFAASNKILMLDEVDAINVYE